MTALVISRGTNIRMTIRTVLTLAPGGEVTPDRSAPIQHRIVAHSVGPGFPSYLGIICGGYLLRVEGGRGPETAHSSAHSGFIPTSRPGIFQACSLLAPLELIAPGL